MIRRMASRPGRLVARVTVLVIAGHLSHFAGAVLAPGDRGILGLSTLDARPLFYAATLAGVIFAFEPRWEAPRWAFVVLVTLTAWGRAVHLLILGSDAVDRSREISGAFSWAIVWLAAVLAAMALTVGNLLSNDRR